MRWLATSRSLLSLKTGGTHSMRMNAKTFELAWGFWKSVSYPSVPVFKRSSSVETLSHAGITDSASGSATSDIVRVRPTRSAILLIGGDKIGNDRWYDENVPRADRLYDEHLESLEREGQR